MIARNYELSGNICSCFIAIYYAALIELYFGKRWFLYANVVKLVLLSNPSKISLF